MTLTYTSELQEMASWFESEREQTTKLQGTVKELTTQNQEANDRIAQLTSTEKTLKDKNRDLVSTCRWFNIVCHMLTIPRSAICTI
jgi:septal ring factor EnvC (AmiA/AmiB activator)